MCASYVLAGVVVSQLDTPGSVCEEVSSLTKEELKLYVEHQTTLVGLRPEFPGSLPAEP